MNWVNENWLILLIGLGIVLLLAFVLLRPRQRVALTSDEAPRRPHMAARSGGEHKGIADEAAAAASDVAGEFLDAPVHANLPGASGPPDDLTRLKGVGPKLATMLNARGIIRFDQLANLSEADIERLDAELGAFRGRLTRDQVPQQADYLARGDSDGFEQRFGRL